MNFVPYNRYDKKWRTLLTGSHLLFILTFFSGVVLYELNKSHYAMFLLVTGVIIAIVHSVLNLMARKHKYKN